MKGAAVGGQAAGWRQSPAARQALAQARRLIRLAFRVRRRARRAVVRVSDRWRRSLQLRVITATFVVSGVVVTVLGFVLMQQIAQNIERLSRNELTTDLVPGKFSRFEKRDASAETRRGDRRRRTRGSPADHRYVELGTLHFHSSTPIR